MAFTATDHGLAGTGTSILTRIGGFFTAYADAKSRRAEFEVLEALCDAELAERGLTRDGIAGHVFADLLYL